ncbi:MAG TPA: hypothetical protein PKZ45_00725, partial [Dysgonamonadaceae bacterium]|nr:hypothetical protein [Dysgonamonadaceae bacterium]
MALNDIISKIFGNKAQRDLKAINPVVEKIKAVYPEITKLSNDELRARTKALEAQIQSSVSDERAK